MTVSRQAFHARPEAPIGVFDSGIGGLTVVKEIRELLPAEDLIYFGDTARIPYGTKSDETVQRFALEDSFLLLDKGVKLIVVACNTASAIAIDTLRRLLPVPVVGVIEPGARAAARATRNGRIGVLGTATTIRSNAYRKFLLGQNPDLLVVSQACPLFVPLVEEGWVAEEATYLIARRYLQSLLENQVDTVILGCTHYPLLKPVIGQILGQEVQLIDSGVEAARQVQQLLRRKQLENNKGKGELRFYLSDLPYKFQEIGERFLQQSLPHVETVNFEAFLLSKGKRFWQALIGEEDAGEPGG